jgi:hypothetical protein
MGAHPDDTWCKNIGTEITGPRYVNWLKDQAMLPNAVPNAQIMRYRYESQWFGKEATQQRATGVAQRLLIALKLERKVYV